jgi:tRNA/tmRNA/rRNA uracil-C5-methylase (TrmA/RlmC/RlmD family)
VLGLFAAGTHDVQPIPRCAAHHPSINAAAAAVASAAAAARTVPYDDVTASGELRYVQLTTHGAGEGARVEVTLVWASAPPAPGAPPPEALTRLAAALRAAAPRQLLAALWVNYHPAAGNAITGEHWARLNDPENEQKQQSGGGGDRNVHADADASDETWHWERFGGADVAFTPAAFLQANYGAFDALLAALASALAARGAARHPVVDLYAGTGAIGLAMLASGAAATLTAVEITPAAARPFAAAAQRLAAAQRRTSADADASPPLARMHIAPAGGAAALAALSCGEVLIVDPPRRGLDAPLLAALMQRAPSGAPSGPAARTHTLAYVSCGFPALRRDAAALRAAGWALASARAFAFFPGTDALETLAIFVRAPPVADVADADASSAPLRGGAAAVAAGVREAEVGGARKPVRRRARQARRAAARDAVAAALESGARDGVKHNARDNAVHE